MKVLFCVHKRNRLRNFTTVIRRMAQRGYSVRIAFLPIKGVSKLSRILKHRPNITSVPCPPFRKERPYRKDRWDALAHLSRAGIDYLRYFNPGYESCTGL